MNKIFLLLFFATFAMGCKSKSATNTQLNNKAEVALKGEWTISSVTYAGSDYIKVTSFDLADSKCFVGSKWRFISNNNKGNMALNSPNCTSFTSPITWFINKESQLILKILNDTKSKKVLTGYVLKVANITDTSFQLIDGISVGGKSIEVVYQFSKN